MLLLTAAAAWGDEHDAYKQLAETVGQADTSLIIAGVPISNSETYPVNQKLAVSKTLALHCGSKKSVRTLCIKQVHPSGRVGQLGFALLPIFRACRQTMCGMLAVMNVQLPGPAAAPGPVLKCHQPRSTAYIH